MAMLPGGDPPVRAEIVHSSERTRITRLFLRGRTIIRKELLGPDAERRLQRETAMLERLRGMAGLVQLAEASPELGAQLDRTRTEFAHGQGPAAGTGHGELAFGALTVAWLGPGTAASWLMSAANSPKDRLCSASDSAFSGAGWTSISRP